MPLKKYYIVIAILVISAIAVSIILMPKSQEIALMEMKDKHFEEARKDYQKQLAEGNLTPEVVNNLTDLYLQIGAVDKAIEVMQQYIALHPDNLAARQKIG